MKTKKLFLFATALLFFGVFFVNVDGVSNVAKADCWGDYNVCYDNATDDNEVNVCGVSYDNCQESIIGGAGSMPTTGGAVNDDLDSYCDTAEGQNDSRCTDVYDYYDTDAEGEALANCNETNGTWDSSIGACSWTTTPAETDSTCDSSSSCMFWNCCPSETTTTDAPTAEDRAANDKNRLAANSASAVQQNAIKQVNTANASLANCGVDAARCAAAQDAVNAANSALLEANARAEAAIAAYNASNAFVNPTTASNGSGFMLCANGALATVCEGSTGTPYVAGLGGGYTGGYSSGGGLPGATAGASIQPKCGNGFQDIGGVCFPMNTGLSNAPIYVIVSNIFSWLMGMFTTLAVLAFVVSGVQYLMAAGDSDLAETAKDNAKNALIGIVVGLSGFIIIKAIAAALSGQSIFF